MTWYVEVTHPSSGNVIRPRVLDGVEIVPSANGLPRIRVPVPRNEKWTDSDFEQADMEVWKDGVRQPIEELSEIETREDKVVLMGRGGIELLDTIQREYDAKEIHLAAENIIKNETSYQANVDSPSGTVTANEQVATASSTSEFQAELPSGGLSASTPAEVASGEVHTLQTAFTTEGENTSDSSANTDSDGSYSGGTAVEIGNATGDYAEWNFTLDYDLSADDFAVFARDDDIGSSGDVDIEWYLEHKNGNTYTIATQTIVNGTLVFGWTDVGDTFGPGYSGPDLTAGSYTVGVKITAINTAGPIYIVDVVCPRDTRYSYTDDNSNDGSGGYLDGPELYPDALEVEFENEPQIISVSGGKIASTWDDTSGSQQLAVSNDGGNTYPLTAANTSTLEQDFSDLGASIRFRATLSRYGSRTSATPQTGFNAQSLQEFTLSADLDDTPLVVNQSYDGTILSILQDLANKADDLFAYEVDYGVESVEWTQPGARQNNKQLDIGRYQSTKTTADVHERVKVRGSSQRRRAEQFTSNHGSFVDLQRSQLAEQKEVVYDPSDGTQFEESSDYVMDWQGGRIKTLANGSMTDSTDFEISYNWRPEDEYTAEGVSSPSQPVVVDIPALGSRRACGQAAYRIVQEVKDPLFKTQITLPVDQVGWSVVADLQLDEIPTNGNRLDIQQIEAAPGSVVFQLGSREEIGDVVGEIQSRVSAVSRRV